jgi:hypothetical protein
VIAVAVVAGALTFGANLTRLAEHPRLQGWNWDVAVGNPHSDDVSKTAIPLLKRNPAVAAVSTIGGIEAEPGIVNGRDAALYSIDAVKGPGLVPYTAGRAPQGASVVNGQEAFGHAVVVTGAAIRALHSQAPVNVFLVRFHPNVDRAATLKHLRSDFPGTVLGATRPPDIENLRRVDRLPALLAGLFSLIALLIVGNMLVNSVRRRRRELAVLRAMGFVRRQVSGVVIWQATTVAAVAIVVGIPIGAAAGRSSWTLVSDRLGLPADPIVPGASLLLVALVALVAANLIAIIPGLLATRTPPATTLHTE